MPTPAATIAPRAQEIAEAARKYVEAAKSRNTRRAYESDWRHFSAWCSEFGASCEPAAPEALMAYVTDLAERGSAPATIRRRIVSVVQVHKLRGWDPPLTDQVHEVEKGVRRARGVKQRQAPALLPEQLRAMVATLGDSPRDVRDRAMLLMGFAGAFRRSELVALDFDDVELVHEGLQVAVRRSKTDQEGEGRTVAIPYGSHHATCPVRAWLKWSKRLLQAQPGLQGLQDQAEEGDQMQAAAALAGTALFRTVTPAGIKDTRASQWAVNNLVKRLAARADLDGAYTAHSMRAGLATAAYIAGKSDRAIMDQGRWTSTVSVNRYIRGRDLWTEDNAAGGVGL